MIAGHIFRTDLDGRIHTFKGESFDAHCRLTTARLPFYVTGRTGPARAEWISYAVNCDSDTFWRAMAGVGE